MKEIKDGTNRWRNIPCSQIRRSNIVKMSILPKAIYRFSAFLSRPNGIFHRSRTSSQFVWKYKKNKQTNKQTNKKKPRVAKAILRKKKGTGGINLPAFRLYYKATVIKQYSTGTKPKIQINGTKQKPRDKSTHLWTPYF